MQRRPREVEDVPDGMEPAHLSAEREEHDARRVGDPAAQKEEEGRRGHRLNEQRKERERHPALDEVERHRNALDDLVVHGDRVHRDARRGARPLDAEHDPADRPAQRDETEGRIRPRDQQIDGAVIEHAEHALRPAVGQEVIERAHRVQDDDAGAEERDAEQRRRIGRGEQREDDTEG